MRKKIIITTIAIISLTAVIAAKNHTPAANTNSIACTADMQKSIAGKILRFHVLANSDSEADQNVKKQVRDAVRGLHRAISAGVRKYRRNQSHRK